MLHSWAGVRPLTYDPALPKGSRSRTIHDLAADGMPNVFAVTAEPLMSHRSAGRDLTKIVMQHLAPSQPNQPPSYLSQSFPRDLNSPPLRESDASIRLADLQHAAEHEYPESLIDLLIRRTGAGLGDDMAAPAAAAAAAAVAGILGWDAARIEREINGYHEHLARIHGYAERPPLRGAAQ